jgi:hypothetical protein
LKEAGGYVVLKVSLTKGGMRGSLPVKTLKFRPFEMVSPAILENSFGDFVILSKYSTTNIV